MLRHAPACRRNLVSRFSTTPVCVCTNFQLFLLMIFYDLLLSMYCKTWWACTKICYRPGMSHSNPPLDEEWPILRHRRLWVRNYAKHLIFVIMGRYSMPVSRLNSRIRTPNFATPLLALGPFSPTLYPLYTVLHEITRQHPIGRIFILISLARVSCVMR